MLLTTCFLICSDWKKSQKKVEKGNEQVNPEGSPCAVVSLIIRLFGVVRYKKEDEVYSSLYLIPIESNPFKAHCYAQQPLDSD